MKMQNLWCCVPLAVTFSIVFHPAAQAVEQFSVGNNVRVACQNMAVYAAPSAMGVPVSRLGFGTSLSVQSLNSPYLLPDSDYKSKKKLEQQAKSMAGEEGKPRIIKPEEYTRHSWVGIGASEFVPASCLVSEKNFDAQTIERAEEKVAALASGKAKRNFSEEEEEGDMRAVRGAAGSAKGGVADYAGIDSIIGQSQGIYDPVALMEFRKVGGLGEFK